jgi:histidine ammonia-lyase
VTLSTVTGLLLTAAAVAALSFEADGANPRIFDPRVAAARPAAGQADAAALFRHLLAGSPLHDHPRSVQDALSFRCLAPVFGSALSALATARRETEIEINHAGDNPLVLLDDGIILPTPNFHTPALAVACDALAIALAQLAAAGGQRVVKLMNPVLSGLPRFLSLVGGASAGFVTQQKTAAALCAEIRQGAMPASLDAMPVSDSVEDHAPMTFLAIRKLAGQLEPLRLLVGLEAMVAAQAADLREDGALSPRAAALQALVRTLVPRLDEDRETGRDATAIADLLARDDTVAALAGDLPADDSAAAPFWGLAHDG